MLNSSAVLSLAWNCHPLIINSQRRCDEMTQAIRGISEYWHDLGSDEFEMHCRTWIIKMNELKDTLARIESGLLAYGHQLQQQEEAQRQAEAKRQTDEKAAQLAAHAKAASKTK